MARFLVCTIPVVGHVTPAIAIVQKLLQNGHEVWWYTGIQFQSKVEAAGAQFVRMKQATDYSDPAQMSKEGTAARNRLTGIKQLQFDLKYVFIDSAVGQLADLTEILVQFPADVVLADSFFVGASWLHEKGGPVWAQLGVSILFAQSRDVPPVGFGWQPSGSQLGKWRDRILKRLLRSLVFREVTAYATAARAKVGLDAPMPLVFDLVSPYLYLASTVPSFEYPRSDLPPQVHFVGPALSAKSAVTEPLEVLQNLPDRPIIHVTQGTISNDPNQLLMPTFEALADENVSVIATTGNRSLADLDLSALPSNVRVEQFIPYPQLLPQVDVMITNGGFLGVQSALAHGIPLITAGRSEEKPEIGARVAWSKVGIDLKTQTPKPEQIRRAVREILRNAQYRDRAKVLQEEISAYDFAGRSVQLLEELARTQAPILSSVG
jgi:MGT family glycosyltransferase